MTDTAGPREAADWKRALATIRSRITSGGLYLSPANRDRLLADVADLETAYLAATEPSAGVTSEAGTVRISELARAVGTLNDGDVIVRREGTFVRWESVLARLPSTSTETPTPEWTDLANDIRRVDGNHDLGAGELADRLTALGWTKAETPTRDVGGLREALLALRRHDIDGNPCWCSTEPSRWNEWRHVQACRDATYALAATTPSVSDEGLDVERLARALFWQSGGTAFHGEGEQRAFLREAKAIAAYYKTLPALASEPVR